MNFHLEFILDSHFAEATIQPLAFIFANSY